MNNLDQYFDEEVSLEDDDYDEVDHAIGMEQLKHEATSNEKMNDVFYNGFESFVDEVRGAYEFIQENTQPSMENIATLNGMLDNIAESIGTKREHISLEDLEDPIEAYNVSIEELSDFFGRLMQVYSNDFVGTFDIFHRIITGRVNNARHYKTRIQQTRSHWKSVKDTMNNKNLLSSYAGTDIYVAFRHDNKLDYKPERALTQDHALSNQVIVDFTKKMVAYTKKLNSAISSGRYDTLDDITKTVVTKIGDMGEVTNVFPSKLFTDRPLLLTNVGWYIKRPKVKKQLVNGKEYNKFYDVITEHMITRDLQFRKNLLAVHIFDDIYLTPKEVDTILDTLEAYCDDIIWFGAELASIKAIHMDTSKYITQIVKRSGVNMDKRGTAVLKQIMRFTKFVRRQQTRPVNWEIERTLFVVSRASLYIRRAIKRAK